MRIVELELVNTNHGVHAIHRHAGDNPAFCFGWQREGPGRWRQRHMRGYGEKCRICCRSFPNVKDLDALYDEMIKPDLEGLLEYVDVKGKAGGFLI